MRKHQNTVWYRVQYLAIVYECGSCKKRIMTISTGYGSKSKITAACRQLQMTAEFFNHNSPWTALIAKKPKLQITQ